MKKILLAAILTIALNTVVTSLTAQQDEWYQGRTKGIYNIGFGGTQGILVGSANPYVTNGGTYSTISPLGITINASGEYKIWHFIGLGWQSGINIYPPRVTYTYFNGQTSPVGIEIPFEIRADIHIMDAANVSIANKLDVYAGLGFGGGPAFYAGGVQYSGTGAKNVAGIIHVGPQVGVRYWFNSKIAIFGEFGWGTSFANAGVTL
jgi:hypothetical protein